MCVFVVYLIVTSTELKANAMGINKSNETESVDKENEDQEQNLEECLC